MLKAVLIDVDDTLLDWNLNALQSMRISAKQMNIILPENILDIFHKVNDQLWKEYEQGIISKETIFQRRFKQVFEAADLNNYDSSDFESRFIDNLKDCFITVDYAKEILDYLSRKYEVDVASNASYSQQESRLKGANLSGYLKYILVSESAGCAKPKTGFFDYCLQQTGYRKDEVIMIGDSLSADIEGAKAYGIQTIWLNRKKIENPFLSDYTVNNLKEIETIL